MWYQGILDRGLVPDLIIRQAIRRRCAARLRTERTRYDLRVVHTTSGQLLWNRPIGNFDTHHFNADGLVVYYDNDVLLLRAQDGALLAGYPAPA